MVVKCKISKGNTVLFKPEVVALQYPPPDGLGYSYRTKLTKYRVAPFFADPPQANQYWH